MLGDVFPRLTGNDVECGSHLNTVTLSQFRCRRATCVQGAHLPHRLASQPRIVMRLTVLPISRSRNALTFGHRDVLPNVANCDGTGGTPCDAVALRDFTVSLATHPPTTNVNHIGLSELGGVVPCSSRSVTSRIHIRFSTLANHVGCIVGGTSKEQVIGANTQWVVTGMTDQHPGGHVAVAQFPSDTMSRMVASVHPERTVVVGTALRGLPHPALARRVNLLPESISDRAAGILAGHRRFLSRIGGVTPRGVSAPPRFFHALNYTAIGGVTWL